MIFSNGCPVIMSESWIYNINSKIKNKLKSINSPGRTELKNRKIRTNILQKLTNVNKPR